MEMSDSAGKGRSFGKIMFSEICLHDKMMIPEKFVRKYGKQLHVGVSLKVPGGAFWHVDLVGDGDKVWLQNGWPKFARFYSLAFGHFLVFKYQGNSQFDVFIYDQRGVEVDYPVDSSLHMNEQKNLNLGEFSQVRKRVAIDVDGLKACKKTRANSACAEACHFGECLIRKLQHKKALVSRLDGNIQPPEQGEDMATQNGGTSATRRGLSGGFRMSTKSRLTKTMVIGLSAAAHEEKDRHASCSRNGSEAEAKAKGKRGGLYLGCSTYDKGKANALASAKDFKSKNPSFILTVRPSFIDGRSQVDIKRAFTQRYMRSNQNFQVHLHANGKTWPIWCYAFCNRCRFARGWSQFAEDNSLSVGDVCVFELVNRSQNLLQVFIYRATKC
ncbi:B3 domain-containing transcription factor VRN1 isoform X2 [Daucus carota subsp. sativus]|uniref:B3 domain-containing transcription factor VRN1 isoform X2 n=1 Tax=Daucus carota subsp. sativus TaxID=79200 RepID=UPI0030833B81